jgi:hypothetical protein
MKVSEWLRLYQVSGEVPEVPKGEELLAFWSGWLIGHQGLTQVSMAERLEMSIKAAEFIEDHAKG